jgi:two-component system, NarL family, invasion response regulator UvrY
MQTFLPSLQEGGYSRVPTLVVAMPDLLLAEMISEWQFNCNFRNLAVMENGKDILRKLQNLKPDFLLIDSELPFFKGFDLAEKLKNLNLTTKIIVYASKLMPDYLPKFLDNSNNGIRGFIHKGCGVAELENCLREVFSGKKYMSSCISEYLNEIEEVPHEEKHVKLMMAKLSVKEKEVLGLIAKGFSESEIAIKSYVSVNTVRTHKYRISEKLNLKDNNQKLTYFASTLKEYIIRYS